jgi:sulfite exporter TauE/SafE
MELTFPLFAGILAAMLHVISGPDHLAAVAPFAIESKNKAWKVGLFWGLGHLLGMLAIGVLFLMFREVIPIEKISEHSEQFVGIILIGLGLWVFFKLFKEQKQHIDSKNTHINLHPNLKQGSIASLSVGFIHGLAGVAHFLLFLPIIGFTSTFDASKYIIGFAIGTVTAMIVFAVVIGIIANISKKNKHSNYFNSIRLAGGFFAFIVGVYWTVVN